MTTKSPSRKWGRRRQRQQDDDHDDNTNNYVRAPDFVMSNNQQPQPQQSRGGGGGGGLTSGISTLFRRPPQEDLSTDVSNNSSSNSTTSSTIQDTIPTNTTHTSSPPTTRSPSSRLFYSDDDSQDSYESRISQAVSQCEDDDPLEPKTIVRYRGFSTSLSSLFLDEPLVCASMGCFGLCLSNRTEYLLQVRHETRGMASGTSRKLGLPSRSMAFFLLVIMVLIFSTFVVWGFGNGHHDAVLQDYYDEGNAYNNDDNNYNGNDDANNNNNNRRLLHHHNANGVFKVREYQEHLWQPFLDLVHDEWYRNATTTTTSLRYLEDAGNYGGYDDAYNNNQGNDDAYNNNYNNDDQNDDQNDDDQNQQEQHGRNIAADARAALALAFLVVLGIVGRKRRMRTRYNLVKARAQEDHLYYASALQVSLQDTREDFFDGACSHTLCGCYPVDPPIQVPEEEEDGKQRKHEDCVSRGFSCFLASCCGVICKCWFQCLSVCALAQEAREIRLLLPPRFQRIDFITHQPFIEYQKDVNDLRRGWLGKTRRKAGIMPHVYALSRLSRYILMCFSGVVVVILLTLLFNPRAAFSWSDAIVLLATFGQSFIVLYVVFWIFHKSDLSLDAVVKFFAAGFLVAVPTAFFFEGLVVNIIIMISYSFYFLLDWIEGDKFIGWVISHWRMIWILGELINAYLVAAVTEELCKYYTFRAVEHPDLIFLTGLDRESNDGNAVDGGHIKYSYGSHQVSNLNRTASFGAPDSHRTPSHLSQQAYGIERTTTEEEFYEDENDARTYRQKAAAVTTGMISVAVGLACAENFLYVFVMGGTQESDGDGHTGGVLEEWIVLFFRSIFPIHALAAAMQSINMIRKFVECAEDNNHRVGVGRIILPAVILHGSFDAILMSINVFVESAWDKYLEENDGNEGDGQPPYNPLVVNLVAWLSIIFIMLVGVLWYYRENRNQRLRLILLEERDKARDEGETQHRYTNPTASSASEPSEVELV